jgi:hypothetical protein
VATPGRVLVLAQSWQRGPCQRLRGRAGGKPVVLAASVDGVFPGSKLRFGRRPRCRGHWRTCSARTAGRSPNTLAMRILTTGRFYRDLGGAAHTDAVPVKAPRTAFYVGLGSGIVVDSLGNGFSLVCVDTEAHHLPTPRSAGRFEASNCTRVEPIGVVPDGMVANMVPSPPRASTT